MKKRILTLLLCTTLILSGCNKKPNNGNDNFNPPNNNQGTVNPGGSSILGDDDASFGDAFENLDIFDGYFENESKDITITCISGTNNAYKMEGSTITFTNVKADTVYSISGTFTGNIVIDTGDSYKFDLELHGLSMISSSTNPITIKSGDEVGIKAKKDTKNYIYDTRDAVDSSAEDVYSGAIHSAVDLEIGGKGELTVVSNNNNGIHSKKDLQVKNLTLFVSCVENSLRGNDSVEITACNTTLIASRGDGIKTTNSDISTKGNQRGNITIAGGSHTIYAACDGIDAAHNVVIDDSTTELSIYTDKYSNYSEEVTESVNSTYYLRYSSQKYTYSVRFINSETGASEWVNAEFHSKVNGGRTTYYYYSFPKMAGYDKLQFFIYSSGMEQMQDTSYTAASEVMTLSTSYDTIAISNSGYSWTNYTTTPQGGGFPGPGGGPGGMQDGNTDKGDHSTKGIKSVNEIIINGGTINIKSYDDAMHSNNDTTLENGATPTGNLSISGGNITVYSNDDGIHADGSLKITDGNVAITNAYEGMEGYNVQISGGNISIYSKDDGINSTATSGTAISISGGTVYICCSGDGIDSNSRTADVGIVFSGGKTVIITNSSMNSAIDTENYYTYTTGCVVAIMPGGGMSNEATHCDNFKNIGKSSQISLSKGVYLEVKIGSDSVTINMPVSISATVVVLGDKSASINTSNSSSLTLDANGVRWH